MEPENQDSSSPFSISPFSNGIDSNTSTPCDCRSALTSDFQSTCPVNYAPLNSASNSPSNSPSNSTLPSSSKRRISWFLFLLVFVFGVTMIPWLAEEITYSLNRGAERAKAEVAKKLLSELPASEQRISWVVKAVAPSVVGIRTKIKIANLPHNLSLDDNQSHDESDLSKTETLRSGGIGSGVIVDAEGHILTNWHVITSAESISVQLNDGRVIESVQLIGQDPATDLAVLKIDAPNTVEAIRWGNSDELEVGDLVIAIGNPFDLGQTVTSGIISAMDRFNPAPQSKVRVQEFLQTDAAINPGNSGGALVDLHGELIGINTSILSQTGGNLGIGFAIPSLLAQKVYEEIIKYGAMEHGWLGIFMNKTPNDVVTAQKWNSQKGVLVAGFFPNSPAREAGIEEGDVLLKWGTTEIRSPLHLSHLIILSKPGTSEKIEILRDGKIVIKDVILGKRPVTLQ
ncbi:MAG: S1C family serine protease [Thermoguttaceae bacterium]